MNRPASSSFKHSPGSRAHLPTDPGCADAPSLALVAEKVATMHFGTVQIVVHDSHVVQIERTERHRFDVSDRK
jgi:hypothetical protein